jgi:hypothetical protein
VLAVLILIVAENIVAALLADISSVRLYHAVVAFYVKLEVANLTFEHLVILHQHRIAAGAKKVNGFVIAGVSLHFVALDKVIAILAVNAAAPEFCLAGRFRKPSEALSGFFAV